MMFLIQEQHHSSKAAAGHAPIKTGNSIKALQPVEAPRRSANPAATTPAPPTAVQDFDLSRLRQWKTIGTLKVRVNRTDVRRGSCDLSIVQPGHRILRSHVFVGGRVTIPGELGARATQITVTSVGKNRVSGYVLSGTGEYRDSSDTELGRRRHVSTSEMRDAKRGG